MSNIISLDVFANSLSQAYNSLVYYWYFLHSHMKANGTFNNSYLPTSLFTCVKQKHIFLVLSLKYRKYNWTFCRFFTQYLHSLRLDSQRAYILITLISHAKLQTLYLNLCNFLRGNCLTFLVSYNTVQC